MTLDAITRLTRRELEVLRGLLAGQTYKEIAHTCGCSEATMKNHANSLYRQFNAQGRAQLQSAFVRESVFGEIDSLLGVRRFP